MSILLTEYFRIKFGDAAANYAWELEEQRYEDPQDISRIINDLDKIILSQNNS